MARPMTFTKKINVVAALQAMISGVEAAPSYFLRRQLIADGYVTAVKNPEGKKVVGSRGRMPLAYSVSKKGENLIRLSKSWGKATA